MTDDNNLNTKEEEKGGAGKKITIFLLLVITVVVAWQMGWFKYLGAEYLIDQLDHFRKMRQDHFLLFTVSYMAIYITILGLSLPVASFLTIFAGLVFPIEGRSTIVNLVEATLVVSFASTIGSTIACFVSRYFLGAWVQGKFGQKLEYVNKKFDEEGAFFLFAMRLVPALPPSAINLLMGLTKIKLWTFYWVSQIGMLAGTAVYVNAGVQLGAQTETLKGGKLNILTPGLIAAFVLLAILPFAAKYALKAIKKTRATSA